MLALPRLSRTAPIRAASISAARPRPAKPYRVLARKYRPSSFDDLIGQEAMVRTVSNAFETGRIPRGLDPDRACAGSAKPPPRGFSPAR